MSLRAKKNRRERQEKNDALVEATKEETTRLNAEIPISLHSQVKIQATKERTSITEIVIKALNDYLSNNSTS